MGKCNVIVGKCMYKLPRLVQNCWLLTTAALVHFILELSECDLENRMLANDRARAKWMALLEQSQQIRRCILEEGNEFEVKTLPKKGRCVFSMRQFTKGSPVLAYHGDLIDPVEAKRREVEYAKDEQKGCFMYTFYPKGVKKCIDATQEGKSLGRLISHSLKNFNLVPKVVTVKDWPYIVFFAKRDIDPGEELSYDYGERSAAAVYNNPWLKEKE